jgi:hypothetical protein
VASSSTADDMVAVSLLRERGSIGWATERGPCADMLLCVDHCWIYMKMRERKKTARYQQYSARRAKLIDVQEVGVLQSCRYSLIHIHLGHSPDSPLEPLCCGALERRGLPPGEPEVPSKDNTHQSTFPFVASIPRHHRQCQVLQIRQLCTYVTVAAESPY